MTDDKLVREALAALYLPGPKHDRWIKYFCALREETASVIDGMKEGERWKMSTPEDEDDVEELKARLICSNCVGDAFLSSEIERTGKNGECSYCDEEGQTISIDGLSHTVETAIETHYSRTSDQPTDWEDMLLRDKESSYNWERHGDLIGLVIAEEVGINEDAADHIQRVINDRTSSWDSAQAGDEDPYDSEVQYERRKPSTFLALHIDWQRFQKSLKIESRLFNKQAEIVLASIFEDLAALKTKKGKPVIADAGPGRPTSALFRARVFHPYEEKIKTAIMRPDKEIGPPPTESANPGRMNARGISVFYGATNPDVALAEVRPPVGSHVIVGRFEIIHSLRLLDVEALRAIYVTGSIFDGSYMKRLEKAQFLETLSSRITIPVMPADDPSDYLVTQAIADYLANRVDPPVDGIIYPSVQSDEPGTNVVLFHKSSRVEVLDIPKGTEISANLESSSEDGPEPDYAVWEETPPAITGSQPDEDEDDDDDFTPRTERFEFLDDTREPALRIDIADIKVHHVDHAKYKTSSYPVRRVRSEKSEPDF